MECFILVLYQDGYDGKLSYIFHRHLLSFYSTGTLYKTFVLIARGSFSPFFALSPHFPAASDGFCRSRLPEGASHLRICKWLSDFKLLLIYSVSCLEER